MFAVIIIIKISNTITSYVYLPKVSLCESKSSFSKIRCLRLRGGDEDEDFVYDPYPAIGISSAESEMDDDRFMRIAFGESKRNGTILDVPYSRPKEEWGSLPTYDVLPGESKEDVRQRFRSCMPATVDDDSFNYVFYEIFWPKFMAEKVLCN